MEPFFKIYRNLYLREKIFKEIKIGHIDSKFQCHSYKFDEIYNCNWMVENNHIGLLYDKVKYGDYLVFNVFIDGTNSKQFFQFFNHNNFRQSWVSSSIEFYLNLFTHYSNYFTSTKELINSTMVIFIKYGLHIGVQVLFDNYVNVKTINYDYSNKDKSCTGYNYLILKSVSHCSLNVLKFINGKKIDGQINNDSKSVKEKFETKIWKKIISYKYNGHRIYQVPRDQYKILKFIIKKMDIKVPITPFPIHIKNYELFNKSITTNHILHVHLYNEPISTLLYCSMIISLLSNYFQPFIESLSNKSYKLLNNYQTNEKEMNETLVAEKPNEILPWLKLKQLKLKYKSLDQSVLVSDIDVSDQDIKYLYKMVIPFTCFNMLMSNIAFYQIKYNFNYSCYSIIQSTHSIGISPISFGDYNQIFTFSNHTRKQGVQLFKFCKQDRKKQFQFINDAMNHLTNENSLSSPPTYFLQSNSMTIYLLIAFLIHNDDLELIKLVVNKFINNYSNSKSSSSNVNDLIFQNSTFSIIKSIETFDYIITTITNNNNNSNSNSNSNCNVYNHILFELKDEKLLSHFQENYPTEFYGKLKYLFSYIREKPMANIISFTLAKHAIENEICISRIDFETIWYSIKLSSFKASEIIWLVENTPLDIGYSFTNSYKFESYRHKNIESALFWLIENRNQDFQQNEQFKRTDEWNQSVMTRCDYPKSLFYLYHYYNNTLDTILLDKTIASKKFMDKSTFVLTEIAKRNDVKTLDLILSIYFNANKKSFYKYLNQVASYGSLSIFKLLVDKYPHVLHISPYSIVSNYIPRTFFMPRKLVEYFDSNDRNPLGLVELYKFEKTLLSILTNNHKDLILYFKNIILTTKIQSFPIGLFTIYYRKGYDDY